MTPDALLAMAERTMTLELAREASAAYSDDVVFPQRQIIERAGDEWQQFPDWPDPVLLLSCENQGICSWGLALDGPSAGSILVGGDLSDGVGTVVHCDDLSTFLAMRRWDGRCLTTVPLLQAQAEPLDAKTLAALRTQFTELPTTLGWPCLSNLRFEADDLQLMLWSDSDQCDWWVSGGRRAVASVLPELMALSDLEGSLRSDDDVGAQLLLEARA